MAGTLLQKAQTFERNRRPHTYSASNDDINVASGGKQVRIEMTSADEWIDFKNFKITYQLNGVNATGGTSAIGFNKYTASSMIKQLVWKTKSGTVIGDNEVDYNLKHRLHMEMMMSDDQETSFVAVTEGSDNGAGTELAATTIDLREYSHAPLDHLASVSGYYPAHLTGGLQLIIHFEEPLKHMLVDAGSTSRSYTVSNLRVEVDMIKLQQSFEDAAMAKVASPEGFVVDYVEKVVMSREIAASTTRKRIPFGTIAGRIKNVQSVFVPDSLVDANTEDKFDSFTHNNLTGYHFLLGNKRLNPGNIELDLTAVGGVIPKGAQVLSEWMKSQNLTTTHSGLYGKSSLTPAVLQSNVAGGKFVIGVKVDRAQTDRNLSSHKDGDENSLTLELNYGSGGSSLVGTQYVIVSVDKRLRIFPGKKLENDDFSNESTEIIL